MLYARAIVKNEQERCITNDASKSDMGSDSWRRWHGTPAKVPFLRRPARATQLASCHLHNWSELQAELQTMLDFHTTLVGAIAHRDAQQNIQDTQA